MFNRVANAKTGRPFTTAEMTSMNPLRNPFAPLMPAGPAEPAVPWQHFVLDELDYGIVVMTSRLEVEYCNGAARRQLADASPIALGTTSLRALAPSDDAALQEALRAASQRGLRRLLTFGTDDRALALAVVPIQWCAGGAQPGTSVLVMLGRRRMCEDLSVLGLARCLGLTPAEGRVLAHLSAQQRPRQIAQRLCVALTTVRTHIASIRAKTGATSIRELIQLMARLPPLTHRLAP
jgi:DNA-binding CsgD family transcriptional regulator